MFKKKNKDHKTISDIKKINQELILLQKEIKKELKGIDDDITKETLNSLDFVLDYKSIRFQSFSDYDLDDIYFLTELIKTALLDCQELIQKGTTYGITLSLNRIKGFLEDRKTGKSPLLDESYRKFEEGLFLIIKLRECAYGEIKKLKEQLDKVTKTALQEKDSTMRIRYFEDMKVIENNILRLENEAHHYDTMQTVLQNQDTLKKVYKEYHVSKDQISTLGDFENAVIKYEKR